jgi:hypothetical protein
MHTGNDPPSWNFVHNPDHYTTVNILVQFTDYLGLFKTNYIIFRNAGNFKKKIRFFFVIESEESDEIFGNVSFVEMKSSKLIPVTKF